MKRISFSLVLLGFVVCLNSIAKAQMQPGMIDMTPSINTSIDNYNNMEALRRYRNRSTTNADNRQREIERLGTAKIKAGKASTRFVPSPAGTQAAVKNLNFNPQLNEPQDLQGQVRYVQNYVKRFNALMVKNGFVPNDQADFDALVYMLIYEAKFDQEADPQRVKAIQDDSRQVTLNSASNQGLADVVKQSNYETYATVALQAYDYRIKARNSNNSVERHNSEDKAVRFANDILKFYKKENQKQ